LEPLLDDLVKAPLVEHQTLEQALQEHGEHDRCRPVATACLDIETK
jgi:hypothetical protein